MRRTWSSKWVSWVESWLAMNDGDEHEVPRPKLVRTGCRLFWHRDWVWEGDTRGEWSIAEIQILWGERGYISMKWGLERWWVMMMMPLRCLYNSNFMWWTTHYLYVMKLDECDAVISSTHSYHPIIQILWDEPPTISIWYHFQQWCLHHLSTPILSDFAPIQIPWGSYTYVPC